MASNVLHLQKNNLKSLDFAVNRCLMKLFRSNNTEIIAECRRYLQFNLPSERIENKCVNKTHIDKRGVQLKYAEHPLFKDNISVAHCTPLSTGLRGSRMTSSLGFQT